MENERNFTSFKNSIIEEVRKIEVIQDQSINRFDVPEIHNRVLQLLEVIDTRLHEFNHFFENPTSEESHFLQNLFFNINKLKDTTKDLKLDPQKFTFQQKFKIAIESIKDDLQNLHKS